MAVDPDPHRSALIFPPGSGSGSRRVNLSTKTRAVDPHSFYADPDPADFLNADPDPDPGPGPGLA